MQFFPARRPNPKKHIGGTRIAITKEIAAIAILVGFKPNVILLGTGGLQHFPPSELMTIAYEHNIAVEVMSTSSACRTYNVLMSEHRRVLAALVLK
jgi:uncharacterized protein